MEGREYSLDQASQSEALGYSDTDKKRDHFRGHISSLLTSPHWLPVKFRVDFNILLLTYMVFLFLFKCTHNSVSLFKLEFNLSYWFRLRVNTKMSSFMAQSAVCSQCCRAGPGLRESPDKRDNCHQQHFSRWLLGGVHLH